MNRPEIERGDGILPVALNSLSSYVMVTMKEPWSLLAPAIKNPPASIILNEDMSIENLCSLESCRPEVDYIVGFGGGTSCDTAKYLAWKWNLPLILSPSIISVDAWLCRSIAVRENHKVSYIGDALPERLIVDYGLIRNAPPELNRAGIADIISIATALGDWKIAADHFGEKFDSSIFDSARTIVHKIINAAVDIKKVTDAGIDAMVDGQLAEVALCEAWGDARPEEGSEHFLAYCLEEITRDHYIHGNLVALNVLVCLKLQRDNAIFDRREIRDFFDAAGINYSPTSQKIKRDDYGAALSGVSGYVNRENLFKCLWHTEDIFDDTGEYSIDGILDWVYSF